MTECEGFAGRYGLPGSTARSLTMIERLLATDPLAPTTVRDPVAIRRDHIADSLVALALDEVRTAGLVADLGSGAGPPGVVIAAACPEATVWLVESVRRKCVFLERLLAASGVTNARVVCERAETWREGRERCDLVTARALAPLGVVWEYAAPLLRVGGAAVAWRGRRDLHEEALADRAAAELGLEPREPIVVVPYRGAAHRHLHVAIKARATPPRFPRRTGMARKRPLGAR